MLGHPDVKLYDASMSGMGDRPEPADGNRLIPAMNYMWDNRALLHKANGDYDMNEVRYLYRIMLKGDVPV